MRLTVKLEIKAIKVDWLLYCRASIYAVGDVINRVALTPVALMEGQWLAQQLFGETTDSVRYENIPTAVFCHPNVATCGYSEEQARALGLAFDVCKPFQAAQTHAQWPPGAKLHQIAG